MTGLNLSEQQPSDGIGGRFEIGWKTIGSGVIAVVLAFGAMQSRISAVEGENKNLAQQIDQIKLQFSEFRADMREVRADVKELLRRP